MSKRDTIIIAVLINIGLLAVLFMFAMNNEEDRISDQAEINYALEETPATSTSSQFQTTTVAASANQATPIDEVDDVLNSYNHSSSSSSSFSSSNDQHWNGSPNQDVNVISGDSTQQPSASSAAVTPVKPNPASPVVAPKYVEVTVKKGDFLEKIAKANDTTVDEIKKLNNLTSERIDIGQVLKVTPNKKAVKALSQASQTKQTSQSNQSANEAVKKADTKEVASSSDPLYYIIKSGDNPWKIARQFKVRYEDILRLNNLNEDKARNLKVGDKIRVK